MYYTYLKLKQISFLLKIRKDKNIFSMIFYEDGSILGEIRGAGWRRRRGGVCFKTTFLEKELFLEMRWFFFKIPPPPPKIKVQCKNFTSRESTNARYNAGNA